MGKSTLKISYFLGLFQVTMANPASFLSMLKTPRGTTTTTTTNNNNNNNDDDNNNNNNNNNNNDDNNNNNDDTGGLPCPACLDRGKCLHPLEGQETLVWNSLW